MHYRQIIGNLILVPLFLIFLNFPHLSAQPIGEVYICGNTWQESQWGISNVDEMVVLDTIDNVIHIVWTYSPPPPWHNVKYSYYNSYDPLTGWFAQEPGFNMFPGRGGHLNHSAVLGGTMGGRGDIEIGMVSGIGLKLRAWWDENYACFDSMIVDSLPPFVKNARLAFGCDGTIHMSAFEGPTPGQYNYLYYGSYMVDPFALNPWVFVDTLTLLTHNIATSPVSCKAALSYLRQKSFEGYPDTDQRADQDVYLLESEDGNEWNWENKINITNFTPSDVFRPFHDNDVLIDYDDNIHIAFTTYEVHVNADHPESTSSNPDVSFIWHWSEEDDSFTVAADGWQREPSYPPFIGWYLPLSNPQMAIDPSNGYLYILYERRDPQDITRDGWWNSDLWVSVSTDNGLNWSTGTNITSTFTPDCLPPQCASEIQASINDIANDTMHIAYILDKDGGIFPWGEGGLVEAKVVYQKIPCSMIAAAPLLPQFSIHGYPPTSIYGTGNTYEAFSISLDAYPNPFNSSTTISYAFLESAKIEIYNIIGQKVLILPISAGVGRATWDGTDAKGASVSSGIYFARVTGIDKGPTLKLVYLK